MTQPTFINFHPKTFTNIHLCLNYIYVVGNCNTIHSLSNKVCVSNKTEDLNLSLIAGINESKILAKHMSCQCKCKFDGKKCDSNQW